MHIQSLNVYLNTLIRNSLGKKEKEQKQNTHKKLFECIFDYIKWAN